MKGRKINGKVGKAFAELCRERATEAALIEARACPECVRLRVRVAELEAHIKELRSLAQGAQP